MARQHQSSFVSIAVSDTHHPSSSHSRPHNDPLLAPPWPQPLAQERSLGRSLRQEAPQGGGREGACSIIAQARLQARRRVAGGACRGAQARASASGGEGRRWPFPTLTGVDSPQCEVAAQAGPGSFANTTTTSHTPMTPEGSADWKDVEKLGCRWGGGLQVKLEEGLDRECILRF